ncbi:DUF3892 domain-containing protein [Plantibacter sp. VKM Ac-2885]|uniref:DUF3892 domain-containing protein n=1 Tax=Plantibacter sp. VKM Ac-2885 TaxID=2783828 RepID=UPI00188C15F8|nr:DUF3892 domain-containing protein [Plantibacter sp. VKM Ac-2885]MBF4512272.1 DUF3892 domain-containing protein [Plantibacter sp. VKM Ac-2885]
MSIEITHVRFGSTPHTHEAIVKYKWREIESGDVGENDKPSLVAWVDKPNALAFVGSGASRVRVGSVHPDSGQPYLRTYADKTWTNNLLSLPTF